MNYDKATGTISIQGTFEGQAPISIALGEILKAEARQQEIACVTPEKAPELLQTYNEAWRRLHKSYAFLTYVKKQADAAVTRRKSIVVLEVVPGRLKELGLSSTADTREAVLELDEEYVACVDYLSQTEAVLEFIKGKLKSFENAFTAVKKVMQEDAYNMLYQGQDGTSGNTGTVQAGNTSRKQGFGKTKY